MDINRRGFAKLLLGGVIGVAATPLLKIAAIAAPVVHKAKSAFGWIDEGEITFTDIVTHTIRLKTPIIRDNICANNALYDKLHKKTLLDVANDWTEEDINRISTKLTERMNKKQYITRNEGPTRL